MLHYYYQLCIFWHQYYEYACVSPRSRFNRNRPLFKGKTNSSLRSSCHASLMYGLFLLNLDHNDTHIHNIDAKRCKVDNDTETYLWHCRLGHICVKCMKKLHADGLLESLDYESFDTCEPCLMGKMTKTPFSGTMERATDYGK